MMAESDVSLPAKHMPAGAESGRSATEYRECRSRVHHHGNAPILCGRCITREELAAVYAGVDAPAAAPPRNKPAAVVPEGEDLLGCVDRERFAADLDAEEYDARVVVAKSASRRTVFTYSFRRYFNNSFARLAVQFWLSQCLKGC